MNFKTQTLSHFRSYVWNSVSCAVAMLMQLQVCVAQSEPAGQFSIIEWGDVAEKNSVSDGRTYYLERRIAPTMSYAGGAKWLLRSERESEESVQEMLDNLGLKPGLMVADFGCGVGYHCLPIAKLIAPEGQVYGVDIQSLMLRGLVARAKEAGIFNVKPVLSRTNVPTMPARTFDLVLMVDVYHELSQPALTLQAIHQSLRPGGQIALVEYRGEDPDVPILPEHKMTKAQIIKEYEANGFQLRSQYDGLPWQHLMFFGVKEN